MGRRRWAVSIPVFIIVVLVLLGGVTTFLVMKANTRFLLVETDRQWRTELASGNYTGSHMCFDFPTYFLDRKNGKLEDWMNSKQRGFKLAYCSSSAAGGLLDSGGASGVDYIRALPFIEAESVPMGAESFNITISVDENLRVMINGSEPLKRGESRHYDFNMVLDHHYQDKDTGENRSCLVRFIQNTTVTNYGIWKLSRIEFGYSKEPYWWPGSLALGWQPKGPRWSRGLEP